MGQIEMQNKFLLYFFGLIIIIATIVGGVLMFKTNLMESSAQKHLRVAFPLNKKVTEYEPTNITIAAEYIFLENVFSPLVQMNESGAIIPGVAKTIKWDGDRLILTIRDDLKTKSGRPITVDDVLFSLKRLLVLTGNTHGNFKDLVCEGINLESVGQDCPGLSVSLNEDAIIFNAGAKKTFLLPMLAAIDFAIIPRKSVNPKTLAIDDYSETSGVYFVEKDNGDGNIQLKINPYHFLYSQNIPQTVDLMPFTAKSGMSSLEALAQNKVDLVTTVDVKKADEQIPFVQTHSNFENHLTQKIRLHLLVFTEKGIKNLNMDERVYISQKVRSGFREIYGSSPGFESRSEFFPSLGEGGLTKHQKDNVDVFNKQPGIKPLKPFKLGLMKRGGIESWSVPLSKALPDAQTYFEDNVPDLKKNLKYEDYPEAFIVSTDTGFMEDISLISYSLNAGFLGLTKADRDVWISKYMATLDKSTRLDKLKELHYSALTTPWIVPLVASPYSATVRKPWKIKLSDLYANNPLWQIQTP